MKGTLYQFDPIIYPIKLWVIVTNKNEIIQDKFTYYPKEEIVLNFEELDAATMVVQHKESGKKGILIVFENKKSMSVKHIAHESSHAAHELWKHLGEEFFGNEANAYFIGWVADCCNKVKTGKYD